MPLETAQDDRDLALDPGAGTATAPATRGRRNRTRGAGLDAEIAGLDALEIAIEPAEPRWRRIWSAAWPKLAAIAIVLGIWQLVVWSGWRPPYALPGPVAVFETLWNMLQTADFWRAVQITMTRALVGFAVSIVIGVILGLAVARVKPLRTAIGSLITGLQTMPSIAWFPLAILLFQLTEQAILFVVVIGAAPSIANGIINGVDYVPPVLVRAGKMMGARGWLLYRYVILPATLPSFLGGLKQGWAFAWRSLMAGELLVILENRPSIGVLLSSAREFADAEALLATMIVILTIGIIVDALFNVANNTIRRRRGLADANA